MDAEQDSGVRAVVNGVVKVVRYTVVVPVAVLLVGTLALIVAGTVEAYEALSHAIGGGDGKEIVVAFMTVTDTFLIAMVLAVIAIGLYELFVDDSIRVPGWLVVENLDDLKQKLVSVVIAVLAVMFVTEVIKFHGTLELLYTGLAIGAVILALAAFLRVHH